MKTILRFKYCLLTLLVAGAGVMTALSRESSAALAPKEAAGSRRNAIVRGRYLVDDVAMCSECHTPRDENGQLDSSRYLEGAPTWIVPVHRMAHWADRAPSLAGLGQYSEKQMEIILEKGVGPNGLPIQPPMHVYRMNDEDAKAVIAYLKSLPAALP